MGISLALALYFIIWWITLFAILPIRFGAGEGEADEIAQASGAPASPQLRLKFLVTTLVASVIFALVYLVIAYKLISLDDIPFLRV